MKKFISIALVLTMVLTSFTFVYAADLIEGLTGEGTESNPVLISSVEDWNAFADALNADETLAEGKYYELTADIDFEGAVPTYVLPTFKSVLDGKNHIIKNFKIDGTQGVYALFDRITVGTVKNIGFVDVTIVPGITQQKPDLNYVAVVTRTAQGNTFFENAFINGIKTEETITWHQAWGGFVGHSWWAAAGIHFNNCYFVSKVGKDGYVTLDSMSGPNQNYFGPFVSFVDEANNSIFSFTNCYTDVDHILPVVYNTERVAVTNTYYNINNNTGRNRSTVGYGTAKTTDEMKTIAATLGSAFSVDKKYANDGYPVLAWQTFEGVISRNADLESVSVSKGEFSPKFSSAVTDYIIYVENDVETITIDATPVDEASVVTGTVSDMPLTVGDNLVAITVTAEDDETTKTYNFVVKRLAVGEDIPVILPEGAPEDAILINSLEELKALAGAATEGKYYVLTTDIDLEDGDWSTFIGTSDNPFKGTFHGNSHVIKNFKIKNTGATGMGYGIFGFVDGDALITHVGVENVVHYLGANGPFYSQSSFGGLVAFLNGNATVSNCFAKNVAVDTKSTNPSSWSGWYGDQVSTAGGLIGYTQGGNCIIENCYSLNFQEINDAASSHGGLVGGMPAGSFKSMTNCYANTLLTSCDSTDKGKIVNCYTTDTSGWSAYGTKPGIAVTDAVLKNSATDLGVAYISDIPGINDGYPMLSWEMNLTRLEGNGTEETPFLITDIDTLAQASGHRDTEGKYYKLTNDIDFEGGKLTSYIGSPKTPFKGIFDGDGHIIKNFVIEAPVSGMQSYLGIFGAIGGNAIVKNIGVVNVTVCPEGEWGYNSFVGGLVSMMYDNSTVANSFARNVVIESNGVESFAVNIAGGLVAKMDGENTSVINCYATGVEKTSENCGSLSGLVGTAENFSSIQNCYSDTTLTMVKNADLAKTTNSYYVVDDDATAYLRTGTRIKASELAGKLSDLGSAYVEDTNNINNGYPIQKWEAGMTPDDVEPEIPATAKDATLKSISISAGTLKPAFNSSVITYTVEVENEVDKITVSGVPTQSKATVTGGVTDADLTVGTPLVVTLVVTSENGEETKEYTVTVTRKEAVVEPDPAEPIEISTVEQLKAIATELTNSTNGLAGYTYKLTADLDLGGEIISPIGTAKNPFKGTFDGQKHTISNFKFNVPQGDYKEANDAELDLGLFGTLAGNADIKNLGIINVEFCTNGSYGWNSRAGALAGKVIDNVKIDNCFVRNVKFNSSPVQVGEGGAFIGYLNGAGVEITNCYETGFEEVNDSIASNSAFIGLTANVAKVENCYSTWNLTGCEATLLDRFINCYCFDKSQWHLHNNRPGIVVTEIPAYELGSAYALDGNNINGGHPILAWEPGAITPEPPVEPEKVIEAVETTDTEVTSVTLGIVEQEAYLIVALFDGDKLVGQKFIKVTEADEIPVNLPIGTADTIKVFVMTSNLMPLTGAEAITK